MPWWSWSALGFFAVVVVTGGIVVGVALVRLRRARTAGERLAAALERLAGRADDLDRRLAHAHERAEEVARHVERLDRSLERFSVLTWALGDARRGFAVVRGAGRAK